jgi:hypothetical protein
MVPQPGALRRAFSFGERPMAEPWKLIEFVEHYPGGFQRGTQRGVPPSVAAKLVNEGVAKILCDIGEQPPVAAAPTVPATIEARPALPAPRAKHERPRS